MKKLLATALLLTAGLSTSAHAGFISGTQVTDGGKTVNLQGLEWMPLTYTAGLSRNQIEAAGGFTDRFGGVWNAGDWRYATRGETEALLGSLWGGVYDGYSADNYDGAATFLSLFGALSQQTEQSRVLHESTSFFFGDVNECSIDPTRTCYGSVSAFYTPYSHWSYNVVLKQSELLGPLNTAGMFSEYEGTNMHISTENAYATKNLSGIYEYGSLLVRSASEPAYDVSAPNVVGLISLGLGALLLRRRKTAA